MTRSGMASGNFNNWLFIVPKHDLVVVFTGGDGIAGGALPLMNKAFTQNVPAVVEALRRAPEIIVPLVREIPVAIRMRRPAPRRWSAHEHACHLAHVHALFFTRLDYMLANPAPVIRPYLPGEQDPDDLLLGMDLDVALAQFVDDRQRLVARLEALAPADWERTATHAEYRNYSVFIMFRHLALHDFLHAYRIEELLLRPEWSENFEGSESPTA